LLSSLYIINFAITKTAIKKKLKKYKEEEKRIEDGENKNYIYRSVKEKNLSFDLSKQHSSI